MEHVRFGIVGLGNTGSFHAKSLGAIANAKLTAVCLLSISQGDGGGIAKIRRYRIQLDRGVVRILADRRVVHRHATHAARGNCHRRD